MSAVRLITLSILASLAILGWIYPQQLIFHQVRFLHCHDTGIPFENTFTLISHFFQGGVQLFDRFDGMNYAYAHLTTGVYTLSNMLVAGLYIILSPFFSHPGEALHHFYSVAFIVITVLIRTLGGYLLLKEFTANRWAIGLSLIYLNIFCSAQFYNTGMLTNNLYGYCPLVMYAIVRFFKTYRCEDFCWVVAAMTLAVYNSLLFALGCFYQVIHFFILGCIIVNIIHRDPVRPSFLASLRQGLTRDNVKILSLTAAICFLILLPVIWWAQALKSDFYIANSGLGDTHGRIKGIFSIASYFNFPGRSYALPSDFLDRVLDYTHTLWGQTWMFLGAGVFFFALIGAVASRHPYRWAVIIAAVALLWLNLPANDPKSLLSLPHWINALTNPFSFLVRSFHMSSLLMAYVLLPLVALGIETAFLVFNKDKGTTERTRLWWARGAVAAVLIIFVFKSSPVLWYILVTGGLLLVVLSAPNRWLAVTALVLFIGVDLWAEKIYADDWLGDFTQLEPRTFEMLPNKDPLVLDYQNPKIFPWRYFYRMDQRNENRLWVLQNSYGLVYQFSPLNERYSTRADLYAPRHISYRGIDEDGEIQEYLRRDGRMIYLADAALPEDQTSLSKILSANWDRRLILVRDAKEHVSDPLHVQFSDHAQVPVRVQHWNFNLSIMKKINTGQGVEYTAPLPKDFPPYLTTGVFTTDYYVTDLNLGNRHLNPVQGSVTVPFSFDIGNVESRKIDLLLPKDFNAGTDQLQLTIRTPGDITDIWRNTNDEFGFTYKADYDGWLVLHYPYDPKWEMKVDGQGQKLYRVNRYFIGTYIREGEHHIQMDYWPHTLLRIFIALSMVLVIVVFSAIVGRGLYR
jgi:hypothetical protein